MVCPNCKVTPLKVKNNNYYCPSCEVYIGSTASDIPNTISGTATSRWQLQSGMQKDDSDNLVSEETEDKRGGFSYQKFFFLFILTFTIIGAYYVIPDLSNYISLSPYCNIQIREKKPGFKTDVINELEAIKGRDPLKYINICKYVNTIAEGSCPVSDKGATSTSLIFEDRCYIKGSKMIYFDDIKYLESMAKLSENFWEQQ